MFGGKFTSAELRALAPRYSPFARSVRYPCSFTSTPQPVVTKILCRCLKKNSSSRSWMPLLPLSAKNQRNRCPTWPKFACDSGPKWLSFQRESTVLPVKRAGATLGNQPFKAFMVEKRVDGWRVRCAGGRILNTPMHTRRHISSGWLNCVFGAAQPICSDPRATDRT